MSSANSPKNLYPIQLIEDDVALAQSIVMLLTAAGYACVHYKSAEEFLSIAASTPQALGLASCVVSDIRLPKLSGMDLLEIIRKEHPQCVWPIILITGHAYVEMAVKAMHQGAFDFLTKPFDPFLLTQKIDKALEKSNALTQQNAFLQDYAQHYATLTEQEKKVCSLILENLTNREIAEMLGNSTRTIEIHRASVFKKMNVDSIVDLAKHSERYRLTHPNQG